MSIQANRNNAISLQVAIKEYFRDNNLDEEITDYDFGNGAFTEWHFYCDGDDFKYIDDNILYDYIADLREFRDENFEVFSFRDEISVKILDDELNESKKSARKSIKESVEFSKEKDIYIAQVKDSSISFAYTPIDTDDDFNGYVVFDGDDVIEYLNWKGADDNDMLKAFNDFEKAVKKYTSKEDAKLIIKDFHDKLGI